MRYKQSFREKKEQEQAALAAAGLVSERYDAVSRIELHMTYYQRALDPVLMERTLCFSPQTHARFHIPCAHEGCTGGGYDLAPVITRLARSRGASVSGKIFCHGSNSVIGHGSIAYEVKIQYHAKGA